MPKAAPAPKAEEIKAAPEVKAEPKVEAKPEVKAEPAKAETIKTEPAHEAPKAEPQKEAPKTEAPKTAPAADTTKQAAADKATEERHRRFLLGKKAARTIKMDNGIVIVEAGQDITEEVLQKAKLANKFIELSMNVQ